jgi:hypothetical protein
MTPIKLSCNSLRPHSDTAHTQRPSQVFTVFACAPSVGPVPQVQRCVAPATTNAHACTAISLLCGTCSQHACGSSPDPQADVSAGGAPDKQTPTASSRLSTEPLISSQAGCDIADTRPFAGRLLTQRDICGRCAAPAVVTGMLRGRLLRMLLNCSYD